MTTARPELREDLESIVSNASFHGCWTDEAAAEFDRRRDEALAVYAESRDQDILLHLMVGAQVCDRLYASPDYRTAMAEAESDNGGGTTVEVVALLNDLRARLA